MMPRCGSQLFDEFAQRARTHTNNWAVLVDTSRFWFNYRHVANVLSIYRSVKVSRWSVVVVLRRPTHLKHIIDMSYLFVTAPRHTGQPDHFDGCRRYGVQSTQSSTGHRIQQCQSAHWRVWRRHRSGLSRLRGDGREFRQTTHWSHPSRHTTIKEIANRCRQQCAHLSNRTRWRWIFKVPGFGRNHQPWAGRCVRTNVAEAEVGTINDTYIFPNIEFPLVICRYNEIFFMIDTCQAASMYEKFYSPNILAVASSLVGEDSLSHHVDPAIGVYIIDRWIWTIFWVQLGCSRPYPFHFTDTHIMHWNFSKKSKRTAKRPSVNL